VSGQNSFLAAANSAAVGPQEPRASARAVERPRGACRLQGSRAIERENETRDMPQPSEHSDAALARFLRQIWQTDVEPLLRGKRAAQRRKSARVGGKVAATGGLVLDTLFRLRGKPFTRAMTVMGSSIGAMLPDVWDWKWLRRSATREDRQVVSDQVRRRAAQLPEADALALFDLAPTASRAELKESWRALSQRWHPDKAPDDEQRPEYHVRFITYQAAYERLCAAYDEGRLPHADAS
jgi:hypothetical protein